MIGVGGLQDGKPFKSKVKMAVQVHVARNTPRAQAPDPWKCA